MRKFCDNCYWNAFYAEISKGSVRQIKVDTLAMEKTIHEHEKHCDRVNRPA